MGGDGGTLNNSRHDHVRMRQELGGAAGFSRNAARTSKERASVSLCAASRQPLAMPIVVDRLGQLFRKDALIACILERKTNFKHIRSLARDTAPLVAHPTACVVTREPVTAHGRFVVGWDCGCVVSARAIEEVRASVQADKQPGSSTCVACGKATSYVRLGMTGEERENLMEVLVEEQKQLARAKKAAKKRKRAPEVVEKDAVGSRDDSACGAEIASQVENSSRNAHGDGCEEMSAANPSKFRRLHAGSEVYNSLFVRPDAGED